MNSNIAAVMGLIIVLLLPACSSNQSVQIDIMAAPEIYQDEKFTPFDNQGPIRIDEPFDILYATDRVKSGDLTQWPYYLPERGHVLRLGRASVKLGDGNYTWEEVRNITLLKNRSSDYPLSINSVSEMGVLEESIGDVSKLFMAVEESDVGQTYAKVINRRLARSRVKDIYIYTHGYKVYFDNPVLVSAELWHFLGYEGVFIAYSWPSTPSAFAYSSDLETTRYTARDFRVFLEYLAANTDAERIHIIGYSAGTRVVIDALWQLAMQHQGDSDEQLLERYRIGEVMLLASDYDRDIFLNVINDRFLDVAERVTVYRSETDKALGISSWLLNRRRLGEIDASEGLSQQQIEMLKPNQELYLINVSSAEQASTGKGHNYFRQSPWVSSDILMALRFRLKPEDRGLYREQDSAIWQFPADYIERLKASLGRIYP